MSLLQVVPKIAIATYWGTCRKIPPPVGSVTWLRDAILTQFSGLKLEPIAIEFAKLLNALNRASIECPGRAKPSIKNFDVDRSAILTQNEIESFLAEAERLRNLYVERVEGDEQKTNLLQFLLLEKTGKDMLCQ